MADDAQQVVQRKLIEVALPLEKINAESAREKSIRHGHPSTLHLWWARRPLAAARAVLFAQLVDDPSSHPDRFPTDEAVAKERRRLHELIEELVVWENSNDEDLLRRAHEEILASTDGNPPPILDPFAGGGTIPLEAQRLGLEAHASDLNPVAVLINKALIEIPPKFAGQRPVFPGAADAQFNTWPRATGLAEDVRRYGQWMRDEAEKRIGHLYPQATLPDGSKATVIAWIWARTVKCPNPGCGIAMPLVRSWWLGKKKGKEAYVVPKVVDGRVEFTIGHGLVGAPTPETDRTMDGKRGAVCIGCGTHVPTEYVKIEGLAGRLGAQLTAVVAEGVRTRIYLDPTPEHESAANVARPLDVPGQNLGYHPKDIWTPPYGMTTFADLFTPRQLTALTTFSDLVGEARERVLADALTAGKPEGERLESGGTGAAAYADAAATYLAFCVSKCTNTSSSLTSWMSDRGAFREVFARQAIPMTWDYAESNVFSQSGGSWDTTLDKIAQVVENVPTGVGFAVQASADHAVASGIVLSTDPPYYDNIGYSDLSDYFYVWLRRSLRHVHPDLTSSMLVPKTDELVANPYRHGGVVGAQRFFESGFAGVFDHARKAAHDQLPITVYYAVKQTDRGTEGEASVGWETILQAIVRAGWSVTATWPMRTEGTGRLLARNTNALASSIVLTLRPRPQDAPTTDRRGFIRALKAELPEKLKELQQGAIAPVDLPQAAIGPGMAVFSRYAAVLADDGSAMTVRQALARINEILDEVLWEQEGDFDPDTRFALMWFRLNGFDPGKFGDAESMSQGRVSLDHLERSQILTKIAGKVTLLSPEAIGKLYPDGNYDPSTDTLISTWEVVMHLARVLNEKGVPAAAQMLSLVPAKIDRDLCKELAFLLFAVSEDTKRSKVAQLFNALGSAWNDIVAESRSVEKDNAETNNAATQLTIDS